MLYTAALLTLLAAEPEPVAPRFRAAAGIGFVGGYDFRYPTLGLGPGIYGEAGVTLNRLGLVASLAGGTVAVSTAIAAGLRMDWDVDEVVRLGFGAELLLFGMLEGPGAVSLGPSVSAGFLVWSTARQGGGRHGLEVFLRGVPAFTLAGRGGFGRRGSTTEGIPVTVAGVVGFGYAWR